MFRDKKVIVVMPAYNAGRTVRRTHEEVIDQDCVDEVILVDDASGDRTVEIAEGLPGVRVHRHERNLGYGANQKTCYRLALEAGGDIIIMVHPDYQYTPRLIPAMASLIGSDLNECVLGSRILGGYALKGGMPLWRYVANRGLNAAQQQECRDHGMHRCREHRDDRGLDERERQQGSHRAEPALHRRRQPRRKASD